MEDRLLKLLDTEQLSSSKFADIIGVQRSSVSHILSGRNKPSFDFLQKTLKAFPLLNADWLILEEGDMYEDMGNYVSGGLFDQATKEEDVATQNSADIRTISQEKTTPEASNAGDISSVSPDIPNTEAGNTLLSNQNALNETRKVTRVILFYSDNSFHTYEPDS